MKKSTLKQPEGSPPEGKAAKLCAYYVRCMALSNAALQWWRELEAFMKTMGFHRASSDAGVFIYKHHDGRLVIALVYVDDGLFLGADKALVDSKKRACLEHWECRDTGDVTDFLGMKVNKTASRITIDQKAYLKTVLERIWTCTMPNRPYTNPVGLCTTGKQRGCRPCAATKVSISHRVFTVPHAWNASGYCLRGN